jgi:aldose sugar dehydrogenase
VFLACTPAWRRFRRETPHPVPIVSTSRQTLPSPGTMTRNLCLIALLLLVPLTACNAQDTTIRQPTDRPDPTMHAGEVIAERIETEEATVRLVRVIGGLENPWGLAFLPDGRMLVTERPGRMSIVHNGEATPVGAMPEIVDRGQGGLLDVRLHPNYDANGWIYFTYSAPGPGGAGTALARARLESNALADLEVLYSMEPKTDARQHFGSRISFLNDGTLLFTVGDRGDGPRAQDLMDPAGSTIRLNDDGTIPADNPFIGRDDALPELYTVGNRNSQGMDVHPETGAVWQSEHGPRGGDELNLIEPGRNYGWPEASFGRDYRTGEQIGVPHDRAPQFVLPVEHWTPALAPSGTAFYTGDAIPGWRGHLFIGSLVREQLIRVVLDGNAVMHQEVLLDDQIGRIRHVTQGPDGFLYLLNDERDAGIYRLEPAE